MLLQNKTKHTLPIDGGSVRPYRTVEVSDSCKYDEEKFEKIDTNKTKPKKANKEDE